MTDDVPRPEHPGGDAEHLDQAEPPVPPGSVADIHEPGASQPGWGPTINTGLPASLLPGVSPWDESGRPYGAGPWSDPSGATTGSGQVYRPYDPAVGPPWPFLVAGSGYVPPRLIRWPIWVGIVVLLAQLAGWLPSLH
jgi:hypothetical protein